MKTTLELPDDLVREIKLRAVLNGQKLKDAMAELLRTGLSIEAPVPLARPTMRKHPKTGLPYIECPHEATAVEEMTPDRVAELLLQ